MRWSIRRSGHLPRLSAELRERESVKPLELFFDLVFVLGFTQCTALMVADPHWAGLARGLLVLAMLWWAWSAYAWLTSVVDPEEGSVRVAMFGVIAGLLIVALCVPQAFGDRALPFAIAYGVVRAGHIVLFLIASRGDPDLRRSVLSLSISSAIAIGLLVVAASLDGYAQGLMWILAILLDWGGPALFGMTGWRLVPAHFAERFNLIIILALGESIVVLGVAVHVELTAGVYVAAVLGVGLAAAIWWTYFDVVALVTERRLIRSTPGRERNILARDSLLLPALPDGRRDHPGRLRHGADAGACRRSSAHGAGVRAVRRDRALFAGPRRAAAAQRPHGQLAAADPRDRAPGDLASGRQGRRRGRTRGREPVVLGDDRLRVHDLRPASLRPTARSRDRSADPRDARRLARRGEDPSHVVVGEEVGR